MNVFDKQSIDKEVVISAYKANIVALGVFVVLLLVLGFFFVWLWGAKNLLNGLRFLQNHVVFMLVVLIVGVFLHEGLHGITWAMFCKDKFRAISFGIKWKSLTPYCQCNETLSRNQYLLGGVMPGLVTGIIPLIISMFIGFGCLFWFGIFFTAAAIGDFMVLAKLIKVKPNMLILDHPTEIGFLVIQPPK